jgi:hypothetical protein
MLAIVMVAALADAGALVASLPLAVAVAVPDWFSLELLDPPHAVANAAARHMAAQNKPNLFIVTPLDWTPGRDTVLDPNWFKEDQIRCLDGSTWPLRSSRWPAATLH